MKNLAGGVRDEIGLVIAAIGLVFLALIPGSAFAYRVPDSYGQGSGPGTGLAGPQGGYLGDNPGPGLPWKHTVRKWKSRLCADLWRLSWILPCYFQTFTVHEGPYVYMGYQYSGDSEAHPEYLNLCATRIYEKAALANFQHPVKDCVYLPPSFEPSYKWGYWYGFNSHKCTVADSKEVSVIQPRTHCP